VKSFSPAGMAVKSYYGLGARTFGNPGGATSGNGSFNGGGGSTLVFRHTNLTALSCNDIAFNGATWIAGGGGGSALEIWRSTDAITWTNVFTADPLTVQSLLAVAFGAGTWVAWGSDVAGTSQVTFFSLDDGLTWNPGGILGGDNQQGRGIAYGNGVFVANGKFNTFLSGDGQNFSAGSNFPNSSGFGVVAFDGSDFLVANNDNSGCPGFSSAAVSSTGDTPFSEQNITGLQFTFSIPTAFGWDTGRTVYVATEGDSIASSPTLVPWNGTQRFLIPAGIITDFAFGLSQFVAPASDGTIITSPTGIAWTQSGASGSTGFFAVAFGQGKFVLTAQDGIWTYGP